MVYKLRTVLILPQKNNEFPLEFCFTEYFQRDYSLDMNILEEVTKGEAYLKPFLDYF